MRKFLGKLKRNNKALAYIWGVAGCTVAFFPIIYWILTFCLDDVADAAFEFGAFTGVSASAWTLAKALISALPVFVLITVLLWSAVNAKAKSYET
jgi:uncharacterized membrane protein